jgi:tetratricopeptide (TPR) repeat protein
MLLCLCLCGCGEDPRSLAEQACREAEALRAEGAWRAAAKKYREALRHNPYLARANYGYAEVLFGRQNEPALAAAYLRRCLEVVEPEATLHRLARRQLEALEGIAEGRLEHPDEALRECLWAAREGNEWLFSARLSGAIVLRAREKGAEEVPAALAGQLRQLFGDREVEILRREVQAGAARLEVGAAGREERQVFFFEADRNGLWLLVGLKSMTADET